MKISFLLWKKLYSIQPVWYTAKLDMFYAIYLALTKEMAQKWHLWQELLKSTSKIGKPSYDQITWCRQQSEGINNTVMEDLNLWPIFLFFLIGIYSMQGWIATIRHGFTRKRNTKRLKCTGNLFRKNLQLKDVC